MKESGWRSSLVHHSSRAFARRFAGEFGGHGRGDSAAWAECGDDFHSFGREDRDEVVEDAIGDVLVEDALVAELLEIHFQAFEFDAAVGGRVAEGKDAEVGLARLGAERGELRGDDFDGVIAAGKLVLEGFQEVMERLGGEGFVGHERTHWHVGSVRPARAESLVMASPSPLGLTYGLG